MCELTTTQGIEVRESLQILLVVRGKYHALSDCAVVAVMMFQARRVMSYLGLFALHQILINIFLFLN